MERRNLLFRSTGNSARPETVPELGRRARRVGEPKRLAVIFARSDDGTWLAQIPALRGCRTQGQTMAEAIERIRRTLILFREDAGSIELRPIILGEPDRPPGV